MVLTIIPREVCKQMMLAWNVGVVKVIKLFECEEHNYWIRGGWVVHSSLRTRGNWEQQLLKHMHCLNCISSFTRTQKSCLQSPVARPPLFSCHIKGFSKRCDRIFELEPITSIRLGLWAHITWIPAFNSILNPCAGTHAKFWTNQSNFDPPEHWVIGIRLRFALQGPVFNFSSSDLGHICWTCVCNPGTSPLGLIPLKYLNFDCW